MREQRVSGYCSIRRIQDAIEYDRESRNDPVSLHEARERVE